MLNKLHVLNFSAHNLFTSSYPSSQFLDLRYIFFMYLKYFFILAKAQDAYKNFTVKKSIIKSFVSIVFTKLLLKKQYNSEWE